MDSLQPGEVLRRYSPRILGYLIRLVGSFDEAEDLHQEVMLIALNTWQNEELPEQPVAWLFAVARNKAIDYLRRAKTKDHALEEIRLEQTGYEPSKEQSLERYLDDDLLRLIFTCCHPAIAQEIRIALTLKTVVGFSLEEVARAFLVNPKTMEQRLVRVKRKIKMAGIAYELPQGSQLLTRLSSVLQTIYLMFNEGYSATTGELMIREPLCREAIHLAEMMNQLFPDQAELEGVLALMLLQDSHREARLSGAGELVLLRDQDRACWDRVQIRQAKQLLDHALHLHQPPGPFQIQAAIAALHTDAKSAEETDWNEIVLLYEALLKVNGNSVVRLNYAVALAMAGQVNAAMQQLNPLDGDLEFYHPFYVARAEIKVMLNRSDDAVRDLQRALLLTKNPQERSHIEQRVTHLTGTPSTLN